MNYNNIIYIDMDNTIEDLLTAWCNYLNSSYNLSVNPEDSKDWDMMKLYPMLTSNQVFSALHDEELWKSVKPINGSEKYIQKLIDNGFEVYIVTATIPENYFIKYKYVIRRYFPFIDNKHIIACYNKQLLNGLVMVDDYIENLKGSQCTGILFNQSYNKDIDVSSYSNLIYRADSWADCYQIIRNVYQQSQNRN